MKMPNEVSVMITQECGVPAPLKPIKGVRPWGVGKVYRRCKREYAKQMRKWNKGPKTMTHTTYIPFAVMEVAMPEPDPMDIPRKTATSLTAEFTITPQSRGLFLGH